MDRRLKGRRIAALAADGFEKVELVVPMRALQAAGAKIDVISLRQGKIRGVNLHEPASRVQVDKTIAEANPADYDGLLLPGGFINPDLLRQSADARAFVRAFDEAGKPIASLCHVMAGRSRRSRQCWRDLVRSALRSRRQSGDEPWPPGSRPVCPGLFGPLRARRSHFESRATPCLKLVAAGE
jgi:hypothetical protein